MTRVEVLAHIALARRKNVAAQRRSTGQRNAGQVSAAHGIARGQVLMPPGITAGQVSAAHGITRGQVLMLPGMATAQTSAFPGTTRDPVSVLRGIARDQVLMPPGATENQVPVHGGVAVTGENVFHCMCPCVEKSKALSPRNTRITQKKHLVFVLLQVGLAIA